MTFGSIWVWNLYCWSYYNKFWQWFFIDRIICVCYYKISFIIFCYWFNLTIFINWSIFCDIRIVIVFLVLKLQFFFNFSQISICYIRWICYCNFFCWSLDIVLICLRFDNELNISWFLLTHCIVSRSIVVCPCHRFGIITIFSFNETCPLIWSFKCRNTSHLDSCCSLISRYCPFSICNSTIINLTYCKSILCSIIICNTTWST